MFDVIVIGAGIIGSMIARNLAKYRLNVLVLEKENDVGNVTTMANSAIVHSGYDPEPNSLKAKMNVVGNKMFDQICKDLDVNFGLVGSLTIALYNEQIETLNQLAKRAEKNGVEVKILTAEEVKKLEPNINPSVKAALFAPTCGIVDPFNLCVHAMENACDNGILLHLGEEVIDINDLKSYFLIKTNKSIYETKIVINAAGLHSKEITEMIEPVNWSITPRKGEYYVLDHYAPGLVNHVIFPLPSVKGKGILVTMTTSGNYLVGPSSEQVEDDDDFSCDALTLSNVKKSAVEMVPTIPFNQVIRVFAGLRATCTRHDFIIEHAKTNANFIILGGIESPGLASSPAIADYVVEKMVRNLIDLNINPNFNPKVRPYVRLKAMNENQRNELIKQNHDYGYIVCNCEKISLGEIKDVLNRSVPPHTVKGVKKRVRAGFGKCQGGFCQPNVVKLLSEHFNIKQTDVLYDKENSNILKQKLKEKEND